MALINIAVNLGLALNKTIKSVQKYYAKKRKAKSNRIDPMYIVEVRSKKNRIPVDRTIPLEERLHLRPNLSL